MGGHDWRTFTDWAINQTTNWPAHVTYRSSNDTYPYKRQIALYEKSTGKIIKYMYVNVVIARKTQNIITAYLTSS